jgi:alpha-glucosidase (family GH31 glycosyl hydrolase)
VLNYIQLGGALEIYFFMRGDAMQIIKNYHTLIGKSAMPPYYALGFFQGSNSYFMESSLSYVLDNYAKNDLPLEGMIIEEYNEDRDRIFTWSYGSWKTLPNVTRDMHANN